MEENLNALMTVPVAEYKELIRQSIELKYLEEIRDLKQKLEEKTELVTYYYERWEKADGARAEMEAQLKETSKQLYETQMDLIELKEFYEVKRK